MLKFLTGLSLLFCLAAGEQAQAPIELREWPNFRMAFAAPQGWHEMMPDKSKSIGTWVNAEAATTGKPSLLVMVEGARPTAPDLESGAKLMATGWGGKVADEKLTLDGAPALHIIVEKRTPDLRPVEGIIALHDGLLYLIIGGATEGQSCHEQVMAIANSWKWLPPSSYAAKLKLRAQPLTLDSGTVRVKVPELTHTYPTKRPREVIDLGLSDIKADKPAFLAYIQITSHEPGASFERLKATFLTKTAAKFSGPEPFAWHTIAGPTPRVATQPVLIKNLPDSHDQSAYIAFAMIRLDDDRMLMINFTIQPEHAEDVHAYGELADQIAASVEVNLRH